MMFADTRGVQPILCNHRSTVKEFKARKNYKFITQNYHATPTRRDTGLEINAIPTAAGHPINSNVSACSTASGVPHTTTTSPTLNTVSGAGSRPTMPSRRNALTAAFAQVGAFPFTSTQDAAMIVTLQPGQYSVQVSGVGGTTGVALVEVYQLH